MMEAILSKKTGLPRYVVRDHHASGHEKLVFRRHGKKVTLPGPALSDPFWEAYAGAMAGKPVTVNQRRVAAKKARQESFRALCDAYYKSAAFLAGDELTKSDKKSVLESCLLEPLEPGSSLLFEDCPIRSISRKHIVVLRDRKAKAPFAANKRRRYLNQLFNWAVEAEKADANPCTDVSRAAARKKGFHTWTPEEIRKYEAAFPVGSKARLALDLMAFAGLRRSDTCTVQVQHIREDAHGQWWLVKPQHKNRKRQGKTIEIPILPELRRSIEATPRTALALLETQAGAPFSIKGFGERFKSWCRTAGLPHCSSHGVRKAAAVLAAERGATDSQLQAIFGWEDTKEIRTYTAKMNRAKVAAGAISLLGSGEKENEIVPRKSEGQQRGTKT